MYVITAIALGAREIQFSPYKYKLIKSYTYSAVMLYSVFRVIDMCCIMY